MVINCIQYSAADNKLFSFLRGNDFTKMELKLLAFWSRHPHAKLSLYSIAIDRDSTKFNLRETIYSLVIKNILSEHRNGNNLITYSLTCDSNNNEFVEELSRMDWNQLKVLEQKLEGVAG